MNLKENIPGLGQSAEDKEISSDSGKSIEFINNFSSLDQGQK